jgi:hypothetical protein
MENNLRISQQSLDMDDLITELNCKRPLTTQNNEFLHNEDGFATSPKNNPGDDTFRHYDDENEYSHRASCESFTRDFVQTNEQTDHKAHEEVMYDHHTQSEISKPFFTQQKPGYHHPQLIDEDIESFKTKLESTLLSFKNDAMKDFMNIKRSLLSEQANTIENERNKYNALLSSKQNEIETLKESLMTSNKLNEDLRIRCEILALLSGKNKQLTKLRVTQYKAFKALKRNVGFKKFSKNVLEAKEKDNQLKMKRKVFQSWGKQWKQWKVQKAKEDFDNK